ncbi:MAG: S-methyl-5-thioribose-1-phosphate isomerase [Ignavibacteria bacterium]|nr:S-methyl-5-thioribose-1-phosphate isomerase [Ignavibacteria bacterium]
MLINKKYYRTIWNDSKKYPSVYAIDQNLLPFKFKTFRIKSSDEIFSAIKNMNVRGAPLIGVAAAYGIYFACVEAKLKYKRVKERWNYIQKKYKYLLSARPTSVNPKWAMDKTLDAVKNICDFDELIFKALETAKMIADEDAENCRIIGETGLEILKKISLKKKGKPVSILTHCNAGWLACIDYGTAASPVYAAASLGIPLHVWVEETRPRNQGAKLTAFELGQMNIPHTIITDNAGGYVMQKGLVDIVLTGADRITARGDVCNKIGTYKTALSAYDNKIPFYVCAPVSSIDFSIRNGLNEIEIEERSNEEIIYAGEGKKRTRLTSPGSPVRNFAFDITPARLINGIITEKGITKPDKNKISKLFHI